MVSDEYSSALLMVGCPKNGTDMLEIRRLVLLRELAIRGTLAAVAEALNFSPSAVSQQLSLLERETGMTLLRKAGRRVRLTPQAEVLVESAGAGLGPPPRAPGPPAQ